MQSAFVHCLLRRKCEQYLVVPRLALRTFPASQLPFVARMHCVELSADRYVMYAENDGPDDDWMLCSVLMFGMILTTSPYCPKNSYQCSVFWKSQNPEKISSIGISSWK